MIHRLVLERHSADRDALQFRGLAGSAPVLVELDSSAAMRLRGSKVAVDGKPLIEQAHAEIERAAERLFVSRQFATDSGDDIIRIRLSALDFD